MEYKITEKDAFTVVGAIKTFKYDEATEEVPKFWEEFQKQENAADDYAFDFSIKNNIDPYAMHNSLNKLVELYETGGEKASRIQQMFSTHPDSEKRAVRMKEKADSYTAQQ